MMIFGIETPLQWAPPYRSPDGCSSESLHRLGRKPVSPSNQRSCHKKRHIAPLVPQRAGALSFGDQAFVLVQSRGVLLMRTPARHHPARCTSHLAAGALFLVTSAGHVQAAEFTLMPSPQTVHIGHFAANVRPVLSIDSGDIVTIETAAAMEPEQIERSGVVPPGA